MIVLSRTQINHNGVYAANSLDIFCLLHQFN